MKVENHLRSDGGREYPCFGFVWWRPLSSKRLQIINPAPAIFANSCRGVSRHYDTIFSGDEHPFQYGSLSTLDGPSVGRGWGDVDWWHCLPASHWGSFHSALVIQDWQIRTTPRSNITDFPRWWGDFQLLCLPLFLVYLSFCFPGCKWLASYLNTGHDSAALAVGQFYYRSITSTYCA